jgi:cellobiose phosphorylase
MYQLILESILGIKVKDGKLELKPCIPTTWSSFKVRYRFGKTDYHITVSQTPNGNEEMNVTIDGVLQAGHVINLVDDGIEHTIEVDLQTSVPEISNV